MKKILLVGLILGISNGFISCSDNAIESLEKKAGEFVTLHQNIETKDYRDSPLYYQDYNIKPKQEWAKMSRESISAITGDGEVGNKFIAMWQLDKNNKTNISITKDNAPVITLDSYKQIVEKVTYSRFGDNINFKEIKINGIDAFTTTYKISDMYDKDLIFNVHQVYFRAKADFICITFTEREDIKVSKLNEFLEFINSLEKI